jgi:uncharacterized protein
MSQDNVEVVRDQFEATNERDFPRAMERYAEDVVLVVDRAAFLASGTFDGREAVGQWFGDWFSSFEPGYRFEIEETLDLGDVVLLVASHHGRGRTSGVDVHGQTGYLYTVRAGRIVRVELYRSRAEALAAAGLQEKEVSQMPRRYECLDAGCGASIVAPDEQALVEAVQRHMAEEHDSFELEDVIIDMSTEVDDGEQEER